jgi:CDP-glucose 4,6-dehydratase
MALYQSPLTYNQAFNFSNSRIEKVTVLELVRKTIKQLNAMDTEVIVQENQFHETTYLQLDASKARIQLKWKPCLDLDDTLIETGLWYSNYLNNDDLNAVSVELINRYRDRIEDKSCTKP